MGCGSSHPMDVYDPFIFKNRYTKIRGVYVVVPGICEYNDVVSTRLNQMMEVRAKNTLFERQIKRWLQSIQELVVLKRLTGPSDHPIYTKHQAVQIALRDACIFAINVILRHIQYDSTILDLFCNEYWENVLSQLYDQKRELERYRWNSKTKRYTTRIPGFDGISWQERATMTPKTVFDAQPFAQTRAAMYRYNRCPNLVRLVKYPKSKE